MHLVDEIGLFQASQSSITLLLMLIAFCAVFVAYCMLTTSIYEAAIATAGLDFRSDRLWEGYIDWLKSLNLLKETLDVFDQVLCVPTQQYSKHFDR